MVALGCIWKRFPFGCVSVGFSFPKELGNNLKVGLAELIEGKYPNSAWATFGNLQVVGNGWDKTSDDCGKYKRMEGCLDTELHDVVTLDGKDYRGKAYLRLVHISCFNWRCHTCYKSMAAREAHVVEARIKKYANLHGGIPEHLIVSAPKSYWGLNPKVLRRKAVKVGESCGVIAGCDIFHHARYANAEEARLKGVPFGWRLGFHFHIIGFLKGGYRCRGCVKACSGCCGYEELWRKERERSGWVVKVAMDREGNVGEHVSIFWTAYYQLEHSSIETDVERPHPLTWFGALSYRRLHVKVERVKHVCPICGSDLVRVMYLGKESIVTERGALGYKGELFVDLYGPEGVRFVEVSSGSHGGFE